MTNRATGHVPQSRSLWLVAVAATLQTTLTCQHSLTPRETTATTSLRSARPSKAPRAKAASACADAPPNVVTQTTSSPVWHAGYHPVLTTSAQDGLYLLAPDDRPLVLVNVGSECPWPVVLELDGDKWRANTELAARLPPLGRLDATEKSSPWYGWRYGYGYVATGPRRLEQKGTKLDLARILRNPVALAGSWPNDLWLVVNEADVQGPFSYNQRSEIYRIREHITERVFSEEAVGKYVERWAPIPDGIVLQEHLLGPSETFRISMFTWRGRVTLLEQTTVPGVFGLVRDHVILAFWAASEQIRIITWNAQGQKHENTFDGIDCGPPMFLTPRGIGLSSCAFLEMQTPSIWRKVAATKSETEFGEEALQLNALNPEISIHSNVVRIRGSNWFIAHNNTEKWLVTNHPTHPSLDHVAFECKAP